MASQINAITKYMRNETVISRFAEVVGNERGARSYISSVMLAVANDQTGNLQACKPESVYVAALRAATLSLSVDPATGQAYLVPFAGNATLIVGYKGLIDMAVRTNKYRYINVGPVYEGETVEENRISGFHSLSGSKTSDKIIGWIGAFEMFNGYGKTIYMTVEDIHAHKTKFSKGYNRKDSAWNTNTEQMEKKTVLRLLLRRWGYLDPADIQMLEEIEKDPISIDGEFVDDAYLPDDMDAAEKEVIEEVQRTEQETIAQLGFE